MSSPSASASDDLAILTARAQQLARPLDEQKDDSALDLLVVRVADQQVALEVAAVREVRPPGPVAQVPRHGSALAGVVGGHGEALAVTGLAELLGLPATLAPHEQWVVVLDHRSAPIGLLVDTALDIVAVERSDVHPPAEPGDLIRALLPDGALVLDTPALLDDPRLSLASPDLTEEPLWQEP